MRRDSLLGAISCVVFLGTASQLFCQTGPSQDAEDYTKKAIQHFQDGSLEQGIQMLDPATLPRDSMAIAEDIHSLLVGVGFNPEIIRVNWWAMTALNKEFRADEFAYHVVGQKNAVLLFARVETEGARMVLTTFKLQPAPIDLRDRYPFVLSGVSPLHYLAILLLVSTPLAMIMAGVAAIRLKIKRRWLWLIFSLFGVGQLKLLWIAGPLSPAMIKVEPIAITLLGVGLQKQPLYDPWCLMLSFPLGAVIIFMRIRFLRRSENSLKDADQSFDGTPTRASPSGALGGSRQNTCH